MQDTMHLITAREIRMGPPTKTMLLMVERKAARRVARSSSLRSAVMRSMYGSSHA